MSAWEWAGWLVVSVGGTFAILIICLVGLAVCDQDQQED